MGNSKKKPRLKKGRKRYKIELTSFSILLWCFFILFLLSWTFVLGIFVGRGFLPGSVSSISEVKGKINRLQELVSSKKPDDLIPSEQPDPDPKLAFYEKLSSKKDEVKKSWKPESEERGGIEAPKKEPRPLFPQIHYTVQLASLGDKNRAKEMTNQLINRGYHAYFREADVKGKTYYRVRCGRFMSIEKANDYARVLAEKEGIEGLVLRSE